LHFSHMGLTDARTFIAPGSGTYRNEDGQPDPGDGPAPTDKSSSRETSRELAPPDPR
jgi:hypothetical protein